MALTMPDVEKIARLSRLSLSAEEKGQMLGALNGLFDLVEGMRAVDTEGVEPMTHPHGEALRLRDDLVTETDRAAEYQACAPDVRNRLYIVPQVIEE
ncbi:MAG: Asp-tRNA(Asn)/Glu-tRNA(Gln) amidotransferase subunit GatC [Neisseria sp.]|nr:Asp-tRNA(Asn)/Glu-tRNA(Gln) amidotransferase subunit GatC [Neisseria sp.]